MRRTAIHRQSRRNYAGTSPITRASGTKRAVLARYVRNKRLADAIYLWAFASLTASPGARAFYDEHRAAGDTHHQALRALGNRLVGFLHGCLTTTPPTARTPPGPTATTKSPAPLDTYDRGMSNARFAHRRSAGPRAAI